jgi:hypothetical protein
MAISRSICAYPLRGDIDGESDGDGDGGDFGMCDGEIDGKCKGGSRERGNGGDGDDDGDSAQDGVSVSIWGETVFAAAEMSPSDLDLAGEVLTEEEFRGMVCEDC